ncbi:LacI family DNA-binding transcriptional regulator [Ferdinandcohnia quinoae]|uniref:LacI family DNA-binding transcriptional regulator n=1 Tax=Fredinandcohnia quinoae TaxID=2918902 RepID=A0AAW5E9Q9_9BACI|nr:LacI family DNA-binding transcriptional regulator [Fredinandcohnia sp. SECRCQ15]MCH1626141.1 LacI family DNA-binding transcriptional regulator [Fredinandcohnia sp. SECRCQ15]
MSITIKDVARVANVSPSTVSRVISNNSRISEETKKRVKKAMKQLGYHPNFQARSLVVKSTETVGIVMPFSASTVLQDPFFPEVIRGISVKAKENRYGMYLSTGGSEDEIFEEVTRVVQGRRVDGLILLYSRTDDKVMKYLLDVGFPFTVIGRPYVGAERITFVDNDNIYITKQVTDYLIQLGHSKIAFVGIDMDFVLSIDRIEGYKQALHEAGIEFREDYIIQKSYLKGEKSAITAFLTSPDAPTALVVTDDFLALELFSHLEALNIRIPEDISIISFNNYFMAEHSKPLLTSVDIDIFQLGYEAANCLIEKIKNPESLPKRITIPAKMIERKSCSSFL